MPTSDDWDALYALLTATQLKQQLLGAALLNGSGPLPGRYALLFVLHQAADHSELREQLHAYLQRHLHPATQRALSKSYPLFSEYPHVIDHHLHRYARRLRLAPQGEAGTFVGLDLAYALWAYNGTGIAYVLRHETDPAALRALQARLSTAHVLEGAYANFDQLPSWIGELRQLRRLDLSHNSNLTALPPFLTQLQALVDLNLIGTAVNDLSLLAQLPQLRYVDWQLRPTPPRCEQLLHLAHVSEVYLDDSITMVDRWGALLRKPEVQAYVRKHLPRLRVLWY